MGISFSTTQVSWDTNCTGIQYAGVPTAALIGVFDATSTDGVVGTFPKGALNDCNAVGFDSDIGFGTPVKRGIERTLYNSVNSQHFYTEPLNATTCVLKYRLQASEAAQWFWLANPTFQFNQGADKCLASAYIEGVHTSSPVDVAACDGASDPMINCLGTNQSTLPLGPADTTFATFPIPGSGTGECNNLFNLDLHVFDIELGPQELHTSGGFVVFTKFGEVNATNFTILGNVRADAFYSTYDNGNCALKHRLSSAEIAELAKWGGLALGIIVRNPASAIYNIGFLNQPVDLWTFTIFPFPPTVSTTTTTTSGTASTTTTTGDASTTTTTGDASTTTTTTTTTGGTTTTGVAPPAPVCFSVFDCVDEANRGAGARASAGCVDGQCSAAACLNGFSKVEGSDVCTCTGYLDWAAEGGVRCASVRQCSEDWQCTQNGQFAVCASGTCGCKSGFTDVSAGSGQVDCQCASGNQIDWTTGNAECISLWDCGADWQCGNFNAYCSEGECTCKSGFVNAATAGSTFDCQCQGSNFVSWVEGQPECLAPGECNYDWECESFDCNEGTCAIAGK